MMLMSPLQINTMRVSSIVHKTRTSMCQAKNPLADAPSWEHNSKCSLSVVRLVRNALPAVA